MPVKSRAALDRFLERVRIGDGCWEWIGCKSHGYGVIGKGGADAGMFLAHRFSYELFAGSAAEST